MCFRKTSEKTPELGMCKFFRRRTLNWACVNYLRKCDLEKCDLGKCKKRTWKLSQDEVKSGQKQNKSSLPHQHCQVFMHAASKSTTSDFAFSRKSPNFAEFTFGFDFFLFVRGRVWMRFKNGLGLYMKCDSWRCQKRALNWACVNFLRKFDLGKCKKRIWKLSQDEPRSGQKQNKSSLPHEYCQIFMNAASKPTTSDFTLLHKKFEFCWIFFRPLFHHVDFALVQVCSRFSFFKSWS